MVSRVVRNRIHHAGGAVVGAAGILFTIAGQHSIGAIYPNVSLYEPAVW